MSMTDSNSEFTNGLERGDEHAGVIAAPVAMSPYATGGGGVTFERKVAVQYLAHLLTGNGAAELGDGRHVVSVAFQQAPEYPVDDLVIAAAHPEESEPSLLLSLGVRRSPNLVQSDEPTRKLIRDFVRAVINPPSDDVEHSLGLVVAGAQTQAQQLSELAGLAAGQMDAPGFFDLVETPNRFGSGIRGRLGQLEKLVGSALKDLGVAEPSKALIRQRAWQLLSRLTVLMPRLESPDETDWSAVVDDLTTVARTPDLAGASQVRDRLVALASEYAPKAARIDLTVLRRDAHEVLNPKVRRRQRGWQVLNRLHDRVLGTVRDEIIASDGDRNKRLDRSDAAKALSAIVEGSAAVVITGESGVGKSSLAVLSLTAAQGAGTNDAQTLCINLRHIPKLAIEFESTLSYPLPTLLSELSAPQRMLVIDGADAVAEGMEDAFRYLVDAAVGADLKVIAVTAVDGGQVVLDILHDRFGNNVAKYTVPLLTDSEIQEIVETFPELGNLHANPRSRELLRRLVVVDLLIRGGLTGLPLSDADAMLEVWSGLIRRHERSDRGLPDAREFVLLRLADLSLGGGDRLSIISGLDAAALAGLRQDGLLQTSGENPFMIGPDFAHDEVRRYAVARILLSERNPASKLLTAQVPRWALGAARLACQTLLQQPDGADAPLQGRFGGLQASFDALIETGHGARWGDVPGEALLTMSDPSAVLWDAWPELKGDDAAGLQRLVRLVEQRLRDQNGIVNPISIEPIISLMLEDSEPWRSGQYASDLLRDWLRGHAAARTPTGHPSRILLRERLVEAYADAGRRLEERLRAKATARAARSEEDIGQAHELEESHPELFISQLGYGRSPRRERPQIPSVCRDRVYLELLALLGPDLGDEGEAILLRIAEDAPSSLAPAVEALLTPLALSLYRRGLLAQLTEAYYLDDKENGTAFDDDGIRRHDPRYSGIVPGLAAWYLGPFAVLFQTDPRGGVAVLNRLLNHAAFIRARTLARLRAMSLGLQNIDIGPYQVDLEVTGTRLTYVGDEQVWYWYRGTGVGPYPCITALQALERTCDQFIQQGMPIKKLVAVLLEGCQNLAMVGLIAGMLVRHLEIADNLLDQYFADPLIWHFEFQRVVKESSMLAASSEGIEGPDRRNWSLREAATVMTLWANDERAAQLRRIGRALVENASRTIDQERQADAIGTQVNGDDEIDPELATVMLWASCLNRDQFKFHETPDGLHFEPTPPEEVVQQLRDGNRDIERAFNEVKLSARYLYKTKNADAEPVEPDELEEGISAARELLEDPTSFGALHPWDLPAAIAATALEAHLLRDVDLKDETLASAAEIVLRVSEGEALMGLYDIEESYFEQGADRSAARALPPLLMPVAAQLRALVDGAGGSSTFERASTAGLRLAQAMVNEVRLHLARGLDHLWAAPCVQAGPCHHQVGWQIAVATVRDCALGGWDRKTGMRNVVMLEEPLAKSLNSTPDDSIQPFRLDASIRALAPAAMANICVATDARELLTALLYAQRRALIRHERNNLDQRGTHALVTARALLTLAQNRDDAVVYEQIDAYADASAHLGNLLRGLSAVAEETPDRAATARRIWPSIMRHVMSLAAAGHTSFHGDFVGDIALAALIPNPTYETQYLYREFQGEPIIWWDPPALRSEVEAWLVPANGNATCVDQVVNFLRSLTPEDQAQLGLPWMAELVLARPGNIANRTYLLPNWLVETRSPAEAIGLSGTWQQIVDALVVEGDSRLAPYSE